MPVATRRFLAPSLLLVLSLSACGSDRSSPFLVQDSLEPFCGLGGLPRATYEQRRAIATEAQRRWSELSGWEATPHNKAIGKAVGDVITAISVETPPDWVGAPLPRPASIPTVATAFARLRTACRL